MSAETTGSLTMADVLALKVVQNAEPLVLSGEKNLDVRLRWVHVTESAENVDLLFGREVVLTTLRNVEPTVARLRAFMTKLEDSGAAGVVVELLEDPAEAEAGIGARLAEAVKALALPVIRLRKKVRFVEITEVIHERLVAEQLAAVQFSRNVHEIYTELSLHEANEQRIVERTAELLQAPVVLEDVRHHVLAHAGAGYGAESVLEHWINRSKFVGYAEQTGRGHGAESWLQTPVGAVRSRWGRLVVPAELEDEHNAALVLERAGQTLTIARLAGRDQRELLYQARTSMLHELQQHHSYTDKEVAVRAESLGLDAGAHYVPLVVALAVGEAHSPTDIQLREREVLEVVDQVAENMRLGVLAGSLRSGYLGVILPVAAKQLVENSLQRFTRQLTEMLSAQVAVGVAAEELSISASARRLEEAAHVAEIVPNLPTRARPYYRFADLRLRGVLSAMGQDARMRSFAMTELSGLLNPPDVSGLELLQLYLEQAGNKSALAKQGYLSRPTLYARLAKLEEKLGVSLDSAESRASLQVALLWYRMHG